MLHMGPRAQLEAAHEEGAMQLVRATTQRIVLPPDPFHGLPLVLDSGQWLPSICNQDLCKLTCASQCLCGSSPGAHLVATCRHAYNAPVDLVRCLHSCSIRFP